MTKNGVADKIWSKRVQQSSVGETAFTFPRPSACVSGLLNGRGSFGGGGGVAGVTGGSDVEGKWRGWRKWTVY